MTALLWHWMGCDWDGMSDFQRTWEPWLCTRMHLKKSDIHIRHSLITCQQEDNLEAQFLHQRDLQGLGAQKSFSGPKKHKK